MQFIELSTYVTVMTAGLRSCIGRSYYGLSGFGHLGCGELMLKAADEPFPRACPQTLTIALATMPRHFPTTIRCANATISQRDQSEPFVATTYQRWTAAYKA